MNKNITAGQEDQNKNLDQTQVKIPLGVWGIGIVQFLINTSTVMVFGIAAVYLKAILSVSIFWISVLEGTVECLAYVMRIVSGALSDYLRKRKALMLFGYGMMTLARPIFAISNSFALVFSARIIDRLGNGIQATPRDALVGDLAPAARKGACFGLRQTLGTAGSFFGGVLGIASMILTENDFQMVFWIASVPAVLAVLLLMVLVDDPDKKGEKQQAVTSERQKLKWEDVSKLGTGFWVLMSVVAVFMLARLSEAFLILHAHTNFGLPKEYTPVVLILYNATYSMSSYPIGKLSDRLGRPNLLALGIAVLAVTDLMLAFAPNLIVVLCGIVLWGVQMGVSQSMFLSMVADQVPERLRGTGFGMFYLISGLSLFCASIGAGKIAELWNEGSAYFASFVVASASLLLLLVVRRRLGACSKN